MPKRGSRRFPGSGWSSRTSRLLSTSEDIPSRTSSARVPRPVRHPRGGVERATAGEDRQPAEKRLLLRAQQVVAPGDGVAQACAGAPADLAGPRSAAAAVAPVAPAAPPATGRCCGRPPARWRAAARRAAGRSPPRPGRCRPSARSQGRRPAPARRTAGPRRSAEFVRGRRPLRLGCSAAAEPRTRARRRRAAAPGW